MLKLDPKSKSLAAVTSTTLKQQNILERADLQEAIERSWDAFVAEMGFVELFLVGSEVEVHDACRNRIDLLALSREGTPVIFELKRHRDRLQLLQGISYAGMLTNWQTEDYLDALGTRSDEGAEELRSLLRGDDFEIGGPEIVLIAESFDPEVILAANWLHEFGVPISAFAINAVEHGGEMLISLDQKFPLPGLDDQYVRRTKRDSEGGATTTSWDEAIAEVAFPFARRALDIFRKRTEGSPQRRGFPSIYSSSPLGRLSIHFRRDYLKVYTKDQSPEAEQALRDALAPAIQFVPWGNENTKNSGFTFTINTEAQFEHFLKAVGEVP